MNFEQAFENLGTAVHARRHEDQLKTIRWLYEEAHVAWRQERLSDAMDRKPKSVWRKILGWMCSNGKRK